MYCRDVQLLQAPTRRLRRLRLIANAGSVTFWLLIAGALIARLILGPNRTLASPIWAAAVVPAFLLVFVGGMVNILVFAGWFRIRCPCCAQPWASWFALWISARCRNCGYDCTSGHRDGDF